VVFEADYDKIELQNIVITTIQLRHCHYVTEKHHQNNVQKFFQFKPLPIKTSGYASGLGLIIWWSLKKRSWFWISGFGLGLGLIDLGLKKTGGLGLVT